MRPGLVSSKTEARQAAVAERRRALSYLQLLFSERPAGSKSVGKPASNSTGIFDVWSLYDGTIEPGLKRSRGQVEFKI